MSDADRNAKRAPDLDALRAALAAARAAHRQPGLLQAYRALGDGYLAAARIDAAESAYRTSAAQARIWNDPAEVGRSLLGLGRTLGRTERTDRALLAYTEAVSSLTGRDEALAEIARAELQALREVPGGAR